MGSSVVNVTATLEKYIVIEFIDYIHTDIARGCYCSLVKLKILYHKNHDAK